MNSTITWLEIGVCCGAFSFLFIYLFLTEQSRRQRLKEIDEEIKMLEQAQEQHARAVVNHGGYWNGSVWQQVDVVSYAMQSPYESVKKDFFRNKRRAMNNDYE